MAQKRMLDKKISVSEQVASLPVSAQLIFTWSIPHSDDIGLLPGSIRTLKAMIVPMWEMDLGEFNNLVKEILKQKLWLPFDFLGQTYFTIPGFAGHQTLKKDRQPQTYLEIKLSRDPKKSWEILEDIGFQLETEEFHLESEVKGSEGKRSKGNILPKRKGNPYIKPLINFFYRAVKTIRHVDLPDINGGKVGFLLKKRLEKDKIAPDRIEQMILWYLTRESKYKDSSGEWRINYKYSPDMAVMLSDAFFTQLLSDEQNAVSFVKDNYELLEKIISRPSLKTKGMQNIGELIKKRYANN